MKKIGLIALFVALLVPSARADVVLHVTGFSGTLDEPTSEAQSDEIIIDSQRVRLFGRGWGYILRLDRQELIIIEHFEEAYDRIPIPARFEDYIEPAAREFSERNGHTLIPGPQTVKIEKTGEFRRFGDWRAERVEIDVRDENGEKAEHLTLWMSQDLGVDLEPLEELIRHRDYVSDRDRRHWVDQLVGLEGFPIVQQTTRFTRRGDFTHTVKIVAVSERDVDDSVYEPPEDYAEVRFRSVRTSRGQPLP